MMMKKKKIFSFRSCRHRDDEEKETDERRRRRRSSFCFITSRACASFPSRRVGGSLRERAFSASSSRVYVVRKIFENSCCAALFFFAFFLPAFSSRFFGKWITNNFASKNRIKKR